MSFMSCIVRDYFSSYPKNCASAPSYRAAIFYIFWLNDRLIVTWIVREQLSVKEELREENPEVQGCTITCCAILCRMQCRYSNCRSCHRRCRREKAKRLRRQLSDNRKRSDDRRQERRTSSRRHALWPKKGSSQARSCCPAERGLREAANAARRSHSSPHLLGSFPDQCRSSRFQSNLGSQA